MRSPTTRCVLAATSVLAAFALIIVPSLLGTAKFGLQQKENVITRTYEADVNKGEQIIKKMSGQLDNPMWVMLTKHKSTRDLLAAALGADKYLVSHGGNSMAKELGRVLGSSKLSKASQTRVSPNPRTITIQKSGTSHDRVFTGSLSTHKRATKHMPSLKIRYDVFAPGVMPKIITRSHKPESGKAKIKSPRTLRNLDAPTKSAKNSQIFSSLRAGLLDATGLSDHFAESDTPLTRLQRKVQKLTAQLLEEKAKLRAAKAEQRAVPNSASPKPLNEGNKPEGKERKQHIADIKDKTKALHSAQTMSSPNDIQSPPPASQQGPSSILHKSQDRVSRLQDGHSLDPVDNTQSILNDILEESHALNHAVISGEPNPSALRVAAVAAPHNAQIHVAGPPGHHQGTSIPQSASKRASPRAARIPVVIRSQARPLLCAMPLLAENSGVDCHQV